MSTEATKIMARYRDLWDQETRQLLARGKSPFFFDGVRYVADVEESKSLNAITQPCVIVSASGMIESGRVLHHLKQSVTRTQDCVLVVGYQAPNTLGRRLLDGAQSVRIFGETYAVRCKVREMCGFSAHADWQDLMAMTSHLARHLEHTFIVHAEEGPGLAHLNRLRDAGFQNVDLPENGARKRL
jgi:metallo-beta-lactamase family protein